MEIRSVPRNIHKAPEATAERPGLAAGPQPVKALAKAIRPQGVGLGIPNVDANEQEKIVLEVDPQVGLKAGLLAANLQDSPVVEKNSGVTGAVMQQKSDRLQGMLTLCQTSQQVSSDAEDSLTVVAERQRKLRGEMGDQCTRILAGKEPALVKAHPGLVERVQVYYGRVAAKEQKFADALKARVQDTKSEGQKAQAAVTAANNRQLLVQTMLDLRAGKYVDPAQLKTALETFDSIQAQAAAAASGTAAASSNRRDLKRPAT